MKKVLAMVLVVFVMVMGVGSAVFAAPVDDIMAALEATGAPEVYFPQVEAYLNSITISPAQATAVITHINNANDIANEGTKLSTLSSAQKVAIYAEIAAAAQILNLTTTFDNGTLVVKNSTDNTIFTLSSAAVIKQTGYDYSIVLIGIALLLLAGATALVSRKLWVRIQTAA